MSDSLTKLKAFDWRWPNVGLSNKRKIERKNNICDATDVGVVLPNLNEMKFRRHVLLGVFLHSVCSGGVPPWILTLTRKQKYVNIPSCWVLCCGIKAALRLQQTQTLGSVSAVLSCFCILSHLIKKFIIQTVWIGVYRLVWGLWSITNQCLILSLAWCVWSESMLSQFYGRPILPKVRNK